MGQNKYVNVHSFLRMGAALIALVIFVSMFIAKQIVNPNFTQNFYTWNQTFFGDGVYNKAAPMGFIGYLLITLGGLTGLAFVFVDEMIGKDLTKKLSFVVGALMVAGGAMILSNGALFRLVNELPGDYRLGAGPIVFGILGIVAGAANIAAPLFEDKGL